MKRSEIVVSCLAALLALATIAVTLRPRPSEQRPQNYEFWVDLAIAQQALRIQLQAEVFALRDSIRVCRGQAVSP